ncbi:MAG: 50S ribosomal protein L24 [Actinomycetota bacterium]
MKIKSGDTVRVLQGKDKGVEGEVVSVDPRRGKVLVRGVNTALKHQKPRNVNESGGIVEKDMPIDASNVAVVCPKTGQAGRVGYRMEGNAKVRYHKVSGEELP